MEGSSTSVVDCDRESVSATPCQKEELPKSELQSLNIDLLRSTDGDNSSVASVNESCESPLSSSWDSEPETDIPSMINCDGMPDQGSLQSINLEENYLDMEEQNQFVRVENSDDGLLWEMDNRSYEELLKKFEEKEEELRVSNFKLQLSEQEIIKLNVQVENSEVQLDNVREELKLKEEEIFKLKIQIEKSENRLDNVQEELNLKVEKLQKQYAELNIYSPEFADRMRNLVELHEAAHVTVNTPKYENAILKKELEKKSIENHQLQGQLKMAQKNMAKSELELVSSRNQIQKISEWIRMYKANGNKLHSDSASLSKLR
ncbi:synaptonemal complex protein 1-like [Trifolium pratense]|uniref:synaptonemal complex protein 1-like n=1 Tax=Trifolium pratense TaxID=57577 RepID=UPI001E69128C|nr:synaptonemal complex protein 1-like [Trifolium pratense]